LARGHRLRPWRRAANSDDDRLSRSVRAVNVGCQDGNARLGPVALAPVKAPGDRAHCRSEDDGQHGDAQQADLNHVTVLRVDPNLTCHSLISYRNLNSIATSTMTSTGVP